MANNELKAPEARRKTYVTKTCKACGKEFLLVPWQAHSKRPKMFCGKPCSSRFNESGKLKSPREERICPVCGMTYKRTVKESLAGRKTTCSKECGFEATRKSKIIDPNGFPKSRHTQRKIALQAKRKCDRCGYDEIKDLLVIHHIDHNPFNGDPENILLFCPMCHALEHYRLKTGWFSMVKRGPKNL